MGAVPAVGIYLHMPFCPYLCPYCDFAKEPWRAGRQQRYLAALQRELLAAPRLRGQTLFVGGGTPNMTAPELLGACIMQARAHFSLVEGAEITVECNPDPQRIDGFATYVAAGVNRLSIGAQSFIPAELQALGRQHSPADIKTCVAAARRAGLTNISLDLIFAAPGQTVTSLCASLDEALALEVNHISCYGLTIEEGTPFAALYERDPQHFASQDHEADLYAALIAKLEQAGFEQYELSNFCRHGQRCRHNENYWNDGEFLGFGIGAASFFDGRRWVNPRSLDIYCAALEANVPLPVQEEELQGAARLGEAVMLALRRREGVNILEFSQRYQINFSDYYAKVIAEWSALGLLESSEGSLRLTARGKPLANEVCAGFIALPEGFSRPRKELDK